MKIPSMGVNHETIKTITNKDKKMSKARFINLLKGSSVGIFLSDKIGKYP